MKIEIMTRKKKARQLLQLEKDKFKYTMQQAAAVLKEPSKLNRQLMFKKWLHGDSSYAWRRLQIKASPLIRIEIGAWRIEFCPSRKKKLAFWQPITITPPGAQTVEEWARSERLAPFSNVIDLSEIRKRVAK